jgi:hypothetical protein
MSSGFEEMPWHDAVLLSLSLDRRNPGYCDEVRLQILWPDDSCSSVTFGDCYGFSAEMNFGVVAQEQIESISIDTDDIRLLSIREKWEKVGVRLDDLICYKIETASTASTLSIYAKYFHVESRFVP